MGLFDFLKPKKDSAQEAKSRLQFIIAQQRDERDPQHDIPIPPEFKVELMALIQKHFHIPDSAISVTKEKHGEYDVLDISIELPDQKPQT
ncbi:cell division topological specificity factor MinE [Lysobacter pythonis]|uniref:Cell division topological specificity factor n=1 Tax=Solilutibacter pythonis TaxID=2483112 RepID=A0A3M2HTH3_9GAMM|nr:cell division topological specificity factor MinE [Lysobacter pythonis]RMH93046.1 cell division topological specificity factor MinE [Lysobacter pythonis]